MRRKPLRRAPLWAWVGLCLAGIAHAQAKPGDPSNEAAARRLYREGLAEYNVANYDGAIEKFKQAYVLSNAPELLFNIAQSYRLKGPSSCATALQFYKNFLRVAPETDKRGAVETRISEMAKCADSQPPPRAAPEAAPPSPPASSPAPAPSPRPASPGVAPQPRSLWLPLTLGATGAAVALTGGILLGWSNARYDSLQANGCAPACDPSDVNGPKRAQVAGGVLLGIGGAVLVAGFAVWLFGRSNASEQLVFTPGHNGLNTALRF
jgi:hypothetical protein